jgi:hypothetical protein
LHYLDDLDSKIESMRAHFEREASLENPWTTYNGSLGRPLLNTAKFLTPEPEVQPITPASANISLEVSGTAIVPGLDESENCKEAAAVADSGSKP